MVVVAQISDLHFNGTAAHRSRAAGVLAYLDAAHTEGHAVSGLLVTGDLVDVGLPEEYTEAAAALVTDIPTITLLGNHDDRAAYTSVRDGVASTAPVNSALRLDDLLVLGLDSSVPGRSDGYLADETLDWARAELAAAGDVDVLLSWHHPPLPIGLPRMDERRMHDAERAAALIADHPNVVGTVVGHAHTPAATMFAGRPLIVAPGVSSTLNLPFEGTGWLNATQGPGIAFHIIEDHRLTTHYRVLSTW
ncbi:MAG: metallophosphoesterase [Gordonia sp. (in: high G+C Gram-positive bacteria)]|uniref:metallophosphoesterase n=1 Tax=Gordonia sp. (in: high G+C Gram-positive bacteria) TaxID=84139 RepID=UPI0039E595F0